MHPNADHVYRNLLLTLRSQCQDKVLPWLHYNLYCDISSSRQLFHDNQRNCSFIKTQVPSTIFDKIKHKVKIDTKGEVIDDSQCEETTPVELDSRHTKAKTLG